MEMETKKKRKKNRFQKMSLRQLFEKKMKKKTKQWKNKKKEKKNMEVKNFYKEKKIKINKF